MKTLLGHPPKPKVCSVKPWIAFIGIQMVELMIYGMLWLIVGKWTLIRY